jgi:hypothetical protein
MKKYEFGRSSYQADLYRDSVVESAMPDSRQVKLFFELHDEFNDVERISANRIEQRGIVGDLVAVNAELTCNDLKYAVLTTLGLLRIE